MTGTITQGTGQQIVVLQPSISFPISRKVLWKMPKDEEKRGALSDEAYLEIFIQRALQSRSEELTQEFSNVKRGKLIGKVDEGDLIHVVLRTPTRVFEEEFSTVTLLTVRKIEGKYYLAVPEEVGVIGRIPNPKQNGQQGMPGNR